MSASDLSVQLTALSDSLRTTSTLIGRLGKLTFQPGSEPLDERGGVRVELTQDIHDSLKQLEEDFELLKQEAEDITFDGNHKRRQTPRDSDEARLSAKIARLGEELVHSRQQFRNAQISAKFASDEAKRKEREALIEGYRKEAELLASAEAANASATASSAEQLFAHRSRRTQQKQLTKDEVLVNASSDVTAALRRTHDLLSTELSRSRFAQETFDESTAALEKLGEEYSNLDSILSNSRNLLGTLISSQKSDTWYLETTLYILLATLSWLFFRRILFGPFIKLPLFLWNTLFLILNWTVFKPFFLFLTVTGVITNEPVTSAAVNTPSSSRPPLIVQPSAKGRAPSFEGNHPIRKQGVPAGAGGANAKAGQEPILAGRLSEQIAVMAEESGKPEQQQEQTQTQTQQEQQGQGQAAKDPVRRGDGTILEERGAEQPNPKKKMFEADVEDAKQQQRRKRDEL